MKTVWRFLKNLKIDPYHPAIPLLNIYPKEEITLWKSYLYLPGYCSMIYNNEDVETTQVAIDGSVDKENVGYSGILLSHK